MKSAQNITSPGYPKAYPDNSNCKYDLIGSSDGKLTVITFEDFNTESCCDVVTVIVDSHKVGSFSGTEGQNRKFSFSNTSRITFISDRSVARNGFRATFKTGILC